MANIIVHRFAVCAGGDLPRAIMALMRDHQNIGPLGFIERQRTDGEEVEMWRPPFCKMVKHCLDWLGEHAIRETPDAQWGFSYALKHKVERECGEYTSNGAIIVAAMLLGIRVDRMAAESGDTINGLIYIGKTRRKS